MRSEQADQYIAKILAKKTPYFKVVSKIKLKIDSGVYPTGNLGKLFAKALLLPEISIGNKLVLDYGTGSGFLAIIAAKQGARVVAIDQNPIAIKCATDNAKRNAVKDSIEFRISNNLGAISKSERFDIITAGLPWENAIPNNPLEMAFYDPGFTMRNDLALRAKALLNEHGCILMSYSKRVQDLIPLETFFKAYQIKILVEKIINYEPHYILCLKLN